MGDPPGVEPAKSNAGNADNRSSLPTTWCIPSTEDTLSHSFRLEGLLHPCQDYEASPTLTLRLQPDQEEYKKAGRTASGHPLTL